MHWTKKGQPKVPDITGLFWTIKLMTTAMGEALSDYLVYHMNPFLAVILGAVGLALSFVLQFKAARYTPSIYWLVVTMVAIFGTMVADALHIVIGIPYLDSTVFFAVLLTAVFIVWYRTERTLSIHSITNVRRECFYWATVLATFALGTATGDMTAVTLHLGYLASGILFAVLFILPGLVFAATRKGAVFLFWFSYVMTRPFGASFADWFSVSHNAGGLGYGKGPVAAMLTVFIVILVGYLTMQDRKFVMSRVAD